MVGLRQATENAVRGFVCSAFDISAGANRWLETIRRSGGSVPPPDPTGILPAAQALGCDPDFSGGQTGGTGTGASYDDPGFTGGQCPIFYNIFVRLENNVGVGGPSPPGVLGSYQLLGPIQGFVTPEGGQGIFIEHNNGQLFNVTFTGSVEQNGPSFDSITPAVPGEVDNCGDPQPDSPYPTEEGPITYDDSTGAPVTENVTIIGGDIVIEANGNLIVPVIVTFPSFTLDASVNISTGDIAFNFGGNPGDTGCCPTPETPEDVEDDPEDPPPPMDNKRLVGIKVVSTFDPLTNESTPAQTPPGPEQRYPDIGSVTFSVQVGGVRSYTAPQKLQQRSQFVPVNFADTAYDWHITERPGVTYSVIEVTVDGTNESQT